MTNLDALLPSSSGRTRDFEFVYGEYAISGQRVPYFATSMTVAEALSHLTLAQSLAVDPEEPINLEELMQRDINESRAHVEIANYLKEPNRLKFFNSLTVVLMPVEKGRPVLEFPGSGGASEPVTEGDGMVRTDVGPVTVRRLGLTAFGRISWETDSVAAVIIDGQHRFVALRNVQESAAAQQINANQTRLPILLLVLDPRAGFTPAHQGVSGIVGASRAIFTDINKHAVKVSPEREYLLDDLSLPAVAMRALMTSGIGKTLAEQLEAMPAHIPLAVVDWVRPQSRFDDGLFVTTTQALHQLVNEVIGSPQPPSAAYDALRAWLDRLQSRLQLDKNDEWPRTDIYKRLEEAEEIGIPFALTAAEVKAAATSFYEGIGQTIVQLLLKGMPYKRLLETYLDAGLLGDSKELWLGQNRAGRAAFKTQFGLDPELEASGLAAAVKTDAELAFFVVFQRAFVLAASEVVGMAESLAEAWGLEEADEAVVLTHWLGLFNSVVAPSLGNRTVWAGTAVIPGRIDYGQRAKKAIWGLTLLLTLPEPEDEELEVIDEDRVILERNDFDKELAPLLSDASLVEAPTEQQLVWAARWRKLLGTIAPGRAAGGELPTARRSAARAYRDGLRRYVDLVAAANAISVTDGQRDVIVLVLGARSLGALSELTAEGL